MALWIAAAATAFTAARAQPRAPSDGGRTPSLGQPGFWKWSAGFGMGGGEVGSARELTTELRGALSRDLGNPVIGLASVQVEAFGGTRNGDPDGGVRARVAFPFTRFAVGVDHNLANQRTRTMVSFVHPGRRSGLFSDGTVLRIDATLGGDRAVAIGIEKPIQRRIPPGATRPARDYARLYATSRAPAPAPLPVAAHAALAEARQAAAFIAELTVPWLDHPPGPRTRAEAAVVERVEQLRRLLGEPTGGAAPRTVETEARRFHAAVERAFASALASADSAHAAAVAREARLILLDEVLLPYDRLLGQRKRDDSTRGLAMGARGIFLRWLHTASAVRPDGIEPALGVFVALLDIVEENRARLSAQWNDSRFTWLPLQYALRPEDHDTQAELDALVERATGAVFSDGNFVSWVINEQFQFQLARTIREAEDYHVLWIHDIRGVDDGLAPDELTFRHVVRSYLAALTARARQYDRTGRMPTFIVLLDEWFYQVRQSRPWISLLEDPVRYRLRLPPAYRAWADTVAAAQDTLRAAVAGSRLLQAQRAQFGDAWLRDLVKVHVNVTNATDHTFWSTHIAHGIPVPDNMLRDHRKLVFYDLTEADPYRGEAIFTGAGVGEHYANLSWEDRALLVRGPAALSVKAAARELLEGQGMQPDQVPWHLQPRPVPARSDSLLEAATRGPRRTYRAAALQNQTGFGRKDVNVGKAVLYTLMPSGSVVKVPDSLWNSAFWGSALAGCALRGGRVLIIAPALANAPAPAFGSMEQAYDLLWRLVTLSTRLAPELEARGGLLRTGLYASRLRVTDIGGKLRAVRATFAEHEWLRRLFAFPDSIYVGLDELTRVVGALPAPALAATEFESDSIPKLHLKTNTFASRDAWTLMARADWVAMTWEFIQQRGAQAQMRAAMLATFEDYPDAHLDVGELPVQRWYDGLSAAERQHVMFYSVVGSQNQNTRSMVMDGEDAFVTSGWPAVIPYIDLISLIGQSRWIEHPSELAALLPPRGGLQARLAHWFRLAF